MIALSGSRVHLNVRVRDNVTLPRWLESLAIRISRSSPCTTASTRRSRGFGSDRDVSPTTVSGGLRVRNLPRRLSRKSSARLPATNPSMNSS